MPDVIVCLSLSENLSMFIRVFKALGGKVLAIIAVGLLLLLWGMWSHNAIETMASNKKTIDGLIEKNNNLQEEIRAFTTRQTQLISEFESIEESQVNLLCAARYQQPITEVIPSLPIIKEVTVYRDRVSNCPTLVVDEQVVSPSVTYQPIDEEIAIGVLDNSWRAYCAAVRQEDLICQPAL